MAVFIDFILLCVRNKFALILVQEILCRFCCIHHNKIGIFEREQEAKVAEVAVYDTNAQLQLLFLSPSRRRGTLIEEALGSNAAHLVGISLLGKLGELIFTHREGQNLRAAFVGITKLSTVFAIKMQRKLFNSERILFSLENFILHLFCERNRLFSGNGAKLKLFNIIAKLLILLRILGQGSILHMLCNEMAVALQNQLA